MCRAHASAGPLRNLELSNDVKKVVYVKDLQEDTRKLNELTPADADDLYYAIVRQYSKGTFKDKDTYRGKGTYGSLAAFMANATLVNVTKVAQLASRGEYLFRMWAETLGPRGAENRNQCLGKELGELVHLAERFHASADEHRRYLRVTKEQTNIRLAQCNNYQKGRCNTGDACRFMHIDER